MTEINLEAYQKILFDSIEEDGIPSMPVFILKRNGLTMAAVLGDESDVPEFSVPKASECTELVFGFDTYLSTERMSKE